MRDLGITTFRGILGGGVVDYFNWTTYDINGPAVANTTYATTALTDYAIDYIHQHEATKPDEPWFVYQAYNAPHAANGGNSPYQVPPPELHSVDLSSVGNPAPGAYATNIPIYQADIQSLDTELGRLLAEVDLDKTMVIFVGDNGVPPPVKDTDTGSATAKGSVYEGGVRVPLIVAGAGVTRRGREDELFVTTDIYATVLELTGIPVSHVNNSYSLKPVLSDEAATNGRTHSFSEVSNGTNQRRYALKDKRYKLINNLGQWELYDLVADPKETTNLYESAPHAAVRASLQAEIAALKADAPPATSRKPRADRDARRSRPFVAGAAFAHRELSERETQRMRNWLIVVGVVAVAALWRSVVSRRADDVRPPNPAARPSPPLVPPAPPASSKPRAHSGAKSSSVRPPARPATERRATPTSARTTPRRS